ncbi:MAG: hypothetical protein AAF316_11830, partial [Cyanobacteria bacterium P01_A01_bin.80]
MQQIFPGEVFANTNNFFHKKSILATELSSSQCNFVSRLEPAEPLTHSIPKSRHVPIIETIKGPIVSGIGLLLRTRLRSRAAEAQRRRFSEYGPTEDELNAQAAHRHHK